MSDFLICQILLNVLYTLNIKQKSLSLAKVWKLLVSSTSHFFLFCFLLQGFQGSLPDEGQRITISALLKLRIQGSWPNWELNTPVVNSKMDFFELRSWVIRIFFLPINFFMYHASHIPLFFILLTSFTIFNCPIWIDDILYLSTDCS